jgi:opacity protein-like surface antigen
MIVTTTLALLLNAPSALAVTTEHTMITEVKGKSSSSSSKKKKKSSSSSSSSSSSKSSSSKSRPDDAEDKSSKETKKRPDDGGKSQGESSSKGQQGDGDSSRGGQGSKGSAERGGARGNDKGQGSDAKRNQNQNQNQNRNEKAKAKAKAKTKAKHNKAKNQKAGHKSKHHYKKVRRYHGVFVWGPSPGHHRHYSGGNSSVSNSHMPVRSVNRADTWALGLRAGSLHSGYENADGYADPGLGLMLRYRPVEALGFEISSQEYEVDTDNSKRLQTLTQASIEVFVVPWSRFSPYVLMGVTENDRDIVDPLTNSELAQQDGALYGLHVGIGAEFAIGSNFALDLESRFVQYGDKPEGDPSAAGAIQTTGSLVYHF